MPKYSSKLKALGSDIPKEYPEDATETLRRIITHHNVIGCIYFYNGHLQLSTVPESLVSSVSSHIPPITKAMSRAITELTASINEVNPIVDRLMEDDSVESVIMTNNEGNPILTNVSIMVATNFGLPLSRLVLQAWNIIKEMDPLNELLVLRLNTKKFEIMCAPHPEFNIIVVQHAREDSRRKSTKKRIQNNHMI